MIYFIVNLSGGGGRAKRTWRKIKEAIKEYEDGIDDTIDYKAYLTKYAGHATEIASKLSAKIKTKDPDSNIIAVVGGDGTINEVLNGMDFKKMSLAVIPTGSGNDFVRGVKREQDTEKVVNKIIDADMNSELNEEYFESIDIGLCHFDDGSKRYFGISAGLGMDAIVCKKALTSKLKKVLNKIGLGSLTYLAITVKTLFSMQDTDGELVYYVKDYSGKHVETARLKFDRLIYSAFMNLTSEGGGVKMAPGADYKDGKLNTCAAYGLSRFAAFCKLPFLTAGKHVGFKGFEVSAADKMEISLGEEFTCHTDGEYAGEHSHMVVTCEKGILRILK